MDAARAAAMSDRDQNPHFRRRWTEDARSTSISAVAPPPAIGSFGLVLQAALERRRRAAAQEARATAAKDPSR